MPQAHLALPWAAAGPLQKLQSRWAKPVCVQLPEGSDMIWDDGTSNKEPVLDIYAPRHFSLVRPSPLLTAPCVARDLWHVCVSRWGYRRCNTSFAVSLSGACQAGALPAVAQAQGRHMPVLVIK